MTTFRPIARPNVVCGAVALGALSQLALTVQTAHAQQGIFVNGESVVQEDFVRELARFGVPLTVEIPDGEYWYDRMSGLWGLRGGPTLGRMPPELDLGGPVRADASVGGTGIFINGRELHPTEALYLQQLFGYTLPGRYWMNAMGVGGLDGGPPLFDLGALARQQSGGGSYSRRGPFGSIGSDGNCSYYMTPGGTSVMTGNCG
jgi:hypothetical protein